MLIDWFTFVAQIVNFIILVWLLKRFLYKPILNAIDERESRIASQLHDAEKVMTEAKEEMKQYQEKNEEFDRTRSAMIGEAKEEARNKKEQLLKEAKDELDNMKIQIRKTLDHEQELLDMELRKKISSEVFSIARKTLKDLANSNLEEYIVKKLISKLMNAVGQEREKLVRSLSSSPEDIMVTSSFEIASDLQLQVSDAIKGLTGGNVHIRFQIKPEQIGGIEISVQDYKVSWNIMEYIRSLEASTMDVLQQKALTHAE